MKIKELIEVLSGLDPETMVVLSSDSEGNQFSPLSDHSPHSQYFTEGSFSGEVYDEQELADWDESEEDMDKPTGGVPCIVLWPF